jgi:hypothetical protein
LPDPIHDTIELANVVAGSGVGGDVVPSHSRNGWMRLDVYRHTSPIVLNVVCAEVVVLRDRTTIQSFDLVMRWIEFKAFIVQGLLWPYLSCTTLRFASGEVIFSPTHRGPVGDFDPGW